MVDNYQFYLQTSFHTIHETNTSYTFLSVYLQDKLFCFFWIIEISNPVMGDWEEKNCNLTPSLSLIFLTRKIW